MQTKTRWVPVDDDTAVLWWWNDETAEWQTQGIVAYGDINTERLRAYTPGSWSPSPEYRVDGMDDPNKAPSPGAIRLVWQRMQESKPDLDEVPEKAPIIDRRGMTPDQFYAAVAEAFTVYTSQGEKSPTKRLAETHGVPYSTAVSWVRKARKRGHLPPSTRAKNWGNK